MFYMTGYIVPELVLASKISPVLSISFNGVPTEKYLGLQASTTTVSKKECHSSKHKVTLDLGKVCYCVILRSKLSSDGNIIVAG